MTNESDTFRHLPTVLVVHNKYRHFGGEDSVVQAELELLRTLGVDVVPMLYDSRDDAKIKQLTRHPYRLIFNNEVYNEARQIIRARRVDVVHCHNLFPLLSTAIYAAADDEDVPVVQTVHNYRMGCLNGLHLRNGSICERCSPGHYVSGMMFGCYRGSHLQSLAFGMAQTINTRRGTWEQPMVYITPGEFLREKLIAWGIPPTKIVIKPHFVPHDPGSRATEGQYAVFVGRLAAEKGLDLLLDVWEPSWIPLIIVGDGPLRAHLEQRVQREHRTNIQFVGYQDHAEVAQFLHEAQFLVLPSISFEIFGLVIVEAYAHGVPVVASRLGAMADVVRDNVTGVLFTPNDRADLGEKLLALQHDHAKRSQLGQAARHEYEQLYSAAANGEQLRRVYEQVLEVRGPLAGWFGGPSLISHVVNKSRQ